MVKPELTVMMSRNTESSQNEPGTILKPAWLQRRNSSSAEHSCMAGLLVISHDTILFNLIMPEGHFVVNAL